LSHLSLLTLESAGPVLHLRLNRPAKRNSISDELLAQIHTVFVNLPASFKVVVLSGAGDHFCAGLDLSEVSERTVAEGMTHSRAWHACFDAIQFGPVPVIAVLQPPVVRTTAAASPATAAHRYRIMRYSSISSSSTSALTTAPKSPPWDSATRRCR
jgi:enoyl-CoA hydratase/carnithine racemase